MVAAGTPYQLLPEWFTNYGSRIDAHGWGSQVVTTGYGDLQGGGPDQEYTSDFGGTSAASPMIVGAAACIQGVAGAVNEACLHPLQMRQLITDTGTPQGSDPRYIGPRPNIGAALESFFGTSGAPSRPDVGRETAALFAPTPNPASGSSSIRFALGAASDVDVSVYSVAGRFIARLVSGRRDAGEHTVVWDGGDGAGRRVADGIYFVCLTTEKARAIEKVVLVR
jgi:hypothetical protein